MSFDLGESDKTGNISTVQGGRAPTIIVNSQLYMHIIIKHAIMNLI